MIAGNNVNADADKVVVLHTDAMPWEGRGAGIAQKVLERVVDPRKGRETLLLRLEPGASLPRETLSHREDIFVIEGGFADEHGAYSAHTFVRNPPGWTRTPRSSEGCLLYVKNREPIRAADRERLVIDAKTAQWTPFPHRGADVLHLYRDRHGIETARIGNVHPQKRIPMHDHAMGEETLMLKGCLKDEYTAYTPGMWFRMPIGVPHTPYTEADGCLMLIREGDLVW